MNDPQPPDRGSTPANSVDWFVRATLRQIRRLAVLVVGLTVALVGLIMFVTPGPGLVVLPLGLAILALEFVWARRLLNQVRERAVKMRDDYWRSNDNNGTR